MSLGGGKRNAPQARGIPAAFLFHFWSMCSHAVQYSSGVSDVKSFQFDDCFWSLDPSSAVYTSQQQVLLLLHVAGTHL